MTLRLVLVGAVAALGVSVPGEPSCTHWYDSAQAWATSLLAEWDTWTAVDESESRLPMTANHMACEECRLARMRLVAKANENLRKDAVLAQAKAKAATKNTENKPSPAASKAALVTSTTTDPKPLEPILAERAFGPIVAYVLNQMPERRGDHPPVTRATGSISSGPELSEPADTVDSGIWDELYQLANEPAPTAAQTDVFTPEESDGPMTEESFICGFGGFDLAEENVPPSAKPAAERKSQLDTGVDLDESGGDSMSCLDEVLSRDEEAEVVASTAPVDPVLADLPADVFVPEQVTVAISAPESTSMATNEAPPAAPAPDAARPVEVVAVLADLPSDVFVPMPQPSNLDSLAKDRPLAGAEPRGVAPALPVGLPAKDRPLAGAEPQPARLGDAVELTRRAVSAWVSVLIGPALVNGSRR